MIMLFHASLWHCENERTRAAEAVPSDTEPYASPKVSGKKILVLFQEYNMVECIAYAFPCNLVHAMSYTKSVTGDMLI